MNLTDATNEQWVAWLTNPLPLDYILTVELEEGRRQWGLHDRLDRHTRRVIDQVVASVRAGGRHRPWTPPRRLVQTDDWPPITWPGTARLR